MSDGILGPHPPNILEIGENKGRICDASLIEDHKYDNVKYIIPMKRYAKPFKEKLSSKSFHLAPMQLHQKSFKEDYPKWPKVRNRDSHENSRKQDEVYQSSRNSFQPMGRHKVRHAGERTPP
jgi:hypothetical protein